MKTYYSKLLERGWACPLLIAVTIAVYIAGCQADFVLDDIFLIKNNRYLQKDIFTLLLGDLWAGEPHPVTKSTFYRPLFTLSIYFDQHVGGGDPLWFHLHSLYWHLLAVGLLFHLLRITFSSHAAFWGSILFALHPLQSEVVLWISARNDSMATAFVLLALILLGRSEWRALRVIPGVMVVAMAFLSKENSLALPLWVWLLASDRKWTRSAMAILGLALAFVLRSIADVGTMWPDADHWALLYEKALPMFSVQLSTLLWPWPLSPMRSLPWLESSLPFMLLSAAVLLLLFTILKYRGKASLLGFVLFLTSYVPTLWAVVVNGAFGDRYLYLPMVGLSFVLAATIAFVPRLFAFVPLGWLLIISFRLPDWKDDRNLWTAIDRDYPSAHSKASLAHIYYNLGKYAIAEGLYHQAFDDKKPYLSGCDTYTTSVLKTKGAQKALEQAYWALDKGCQFSGQLAGVMSICMAGLGQWDKLHAFFEKAPPDLSKRDIIVKGALAIVDGNMQRYYGFRSNWGSQQDFERQVQSLLDKARYKIDIQSLPFK